MTELQCASIEQFKNARVSDKKKIIQADQFNSTIQVSDVWSVRGEDWELNWNGLEELVN